MHSLMQVTVKSLVFGQFCFAHVYRDRSETYRQRNINSKHTVHILAIDDIYVCIFAAPSISESENNQEIVLAKSIHFDFNVKNANTSAISVFRASRPRVTSGGIGMATDFWRAAACVCFACCRGCGTTGRRLSSGPAAASPGCTAARRTGPDCGYGSPAPAPDRLPTHRQTGGGGGRGPSRQSGFTRNADISEHSESSAPSTAPPPPAALWKLRSSEQRSSH